MIEAIIFFIGKVTASIWKLKQLSLSLSFSISNINTAKQSESKCRNLENFYCRKDLSCF